ncbi:NUDIX hydrolase [Catellatospora sichuanensis]|uniref:NUDIX hydrolase n=1 Tax=Catellatospora sichuanensis TaxID=1969805 RepID=UPI00118245DF|nr:NUDIX domain-containing protein [Catellatospora sichuanensis]
MTEEWLTTGGRPAFVVNVEVHLHQDGRWLLIRRSEQEAHAAGLLSGVGGKAEPGTGEMTDILEETARREVAEEIAVDLTGVPLTYVESSLFTADDGDLVVNVVFAADLPADARPVVAAPDEVAAIQLMTVEEAEDDPKCPYWISRSLRRAAAALATV